MTIRHLRIFETVAREGKMGAAAKSLFISQPSVSQAIKEIEEYYGVKLFERLAKKLYITENGKMLLQYSRHILESFDEMEMSLKRSADKVKLRVGATITVGSYLLEPIITEFEKQNSLVKVKVVVNNTQILQEMLLDSELDIGIIEGEMTSSELIREVICEDELVMAVSKEHSLYGIVDKYKGISGTSIGQVKISDLEGINLISREAGSGIRSSFEEVLKRNNVHMPIKWECTNTETIKAAVIAGQGVAVFSKRSIEKEVIEKKLHIVDIEDISLSRQICVVYHKDKFRSKQLTAFLELLSSDKLKAKI